MEFTDDPLEYQLSDRGLAYMRPITTRDGASVAVHDSSNAEHDQLWFAFKPTLERSTLDGAYSIGMDIEDALTLAQQIIVLAERRGIRPADGSVVGPALDEYVATAAALNMNGDVQLPDRQTGAISDLDGILELGAFLATVHTAAALAEDIPRRIADFDITAFTQDISAHLASSAEAAQRRIRDIALGIDEDARKVFPPRPHHLNTAADHLERLHTLALAVAARAGAVRAEIECYLDTSTNPAPAGPNPECSCSDGNCDDCKRDRAELETNTDE